MLKIREYFLAYGLGQSSNSRSVFAFIRSSTSLFFTQILFVVTNDIKEKLGKKNEVDFAQMTSRAARTSTKLFSET